MSGSKDNQDQRGVLYLLLKKALENIEFLDLFVRKRKPPVSAFFKPKKESIDLSAFFKSVAAFIIENTERPLTQEKLKYCIETIFPNTTERTIEKGNITKFIELFCYKQLLDTRKIDEKNIRNWSNINVLANQCKQLQYCYADELKVADSVIESTHHLETSSTKFVTRCHGKHSNSIPVFAL